VAYKKGTTTELSSGHGGRDAPRAPAMDLVLRSSEKLARETVDLFDAWAGEIVPKDVPVDDRRPK
jgi:hypothetical protein